MPCLSMKMKIWRTSRITMRQVWPKLINKLRCYVTGSNKRKRSSQWTRRLNKEFFRTPQANPKALKPWWRFQMMGLLHMNRSKHCRKQCRNRCEQCRWKSRNTNLSSMNSNLSSINSVRSLMKSNLMWSLKRPRKWIEINSFAVYPIRWVIWVIPTWSV